MIRKRPLPKLVCVQGEKTEKQHSDKKKTSAQAKVCSRRQRNNTVIYTDCTTVTGDEELSFRRQVGLNFGVLSLHPLPGGAMMDQVVARCNKLHADIHSKQDTWATSHSTTNYTQTFTLTVNSKTVRQLATVQQTAHRHSH